MKSKAHDNEESIFTLQKQPSEMIYAEKLFLKLLFCIIHRKTFLSLFLKRLLAFRAAALSKSDTNTGALLRILQNFRSTSFEEHLLTAPSHFKTIRLVFFVYYRLINLAVS